MRKFKRERKDQEFFEQVFTQAEELFLAINDINAPYIIPLNFVHYNNSLYIHCANEGYKLDLIDKNPHVSFSMVCDVEVLPDISTTAYKSICGSGFAKLIDNNEEKQEALRLIAHKYKANCPMPTPQKVFEQTAVIHITIEQLTGKERKKD